MPKPGMRWRHVTLGTHNSWLPGDPRGFRSNQHKIHSSGDYKHPPPPGEHAGLFAYAKSISGPAIIIPQDCRAMVGKKILKKLHECKYETLAFAVGGMHTHIQVELPDSLPLIRAIIGNCKRAASHAIRAAIPGQVWGRDGNYKPIDDVEHQQKVYQYIRAQENAWIWCFEDGLPKDW